jgi:hypothetical protein
MARIMASRSRDSERPYLTSTGAAQNPLIVAVDVIVGVVATLVVAVHLNGNSTLAVPEKRSSLRRSPR